MLAVKKSGSRLKRLRNDAFVPASGRPRSRRRRLVFLPTRQSGQPVITGRIGAMRREKQEEIPVAGKRPSLAFAYTALARFREGASDDHAPYQPSFEASAIFI